MKILFVRFSSLGDVALTTGVMQYVSQMLPDAEIDVLTYAEYTPIFANLPFVQNVFGYEKSRGISEYFYIVQNEFEEHDYIFDLHGKIRSKFLKFHSKASYHCYKKDSKARRAFVKNRKLNDRLDMHVVEKYFESVIKPLGIPMPELEALRPVLVRHVETINKKVFVHTFASKTTKAYPYAKELAEKLIENGYTPIFGGVGNAPQVEGIIDNTGKIDLNEMLDIIASCEFAISTDSGPMHLAIGLNKPTIGIFGSTTKHFGFYPSFKDCYVLEDNSVECRPCDVHGLDKCPKEHFKCMNSLKPKLVIDLLAQMKVSE